MAMKDTGAASTTGAAAPVAVATATRRGRWVLLATVVAVALTARLGWWQLDRAAQKNALQAAITAQRALPPVPLADLPGPSTTPPPTLAPAPVWQHRSVQLLGQWRGEHTVYLDNRQMNQRVGFYAVTPLQLADGTAVLVQRGWLPRDLLDRTRLQPVATPPGQVQVQGRLAPGVPRLYDLGGAATGVIRQNLDVAAFAVETGLRLRPWVVLQEGAATVTVTPTAASTVNSAAPADGLLRQWPAPATGVHKHHGYAFQWFALSTLCAGLYVWFQHIRPRLRARVQRPQPAP
jgi:surfeit locus 1 family protein